MDNGLLSTVFAFILFIIRIYQFGMIVYFLTSWLPGARESGFGSFLGKIYEPFLEPFRKIIPPLGMFDVSSIVAFFTLSLFYMGLISLFNMIAPVIPVI